jgi:hypothetical protein
MPVLKKRETKTVKLITIPDAEVEIYTSITADDAQKLNKLTAEGKHIVGPLTFLIKDWNLTNEEGTKLKITEGNIGLLDLRDVEHIADESGISDGSFLAKRQTETGSE